MMLLQVGDATEQKAAELFGKNSKSILQDVQIIKEWVQKQPHFPEIMEDVKIRNFLILNKYSIEKTKQKIDMYYTIRAVIPDVFVDCNPSTTMMKEFMDMTYCCVHPKLVEALYRVHFLKAKATNQFCPRELGLQLNNISEVRSYEDCMVGDVIVFDMSTLTLSDLTKITPTLASKLIGIYAKVYSIRVKQVYIINSPSYVGNLMTILRKILKPKIFSRIQVCQDASALQEVFSHNDLPRDYGGSGPSLEELNELMKVKLAEYQKRFDVLDGLRANESLRPEPLNNDEVLGFYGNFKKLSVD